MTAAAVSTAPLSDPDTASPRPAEDRVVIDCRNVAFRYPASAGASPIISDLRLTIRSGEFVCVLGQSGCGKTTLLNLIAGFLRPTSGDVIFEGHRVQGPAPERGMVFQEYSLFPWLTTRANVEFSLRMRGMRQSERRATANRYLELVGLGQAAGRYPFQLSGGMKQRAAIARALAANPRALLMDEPFAALDAMTRAHLQEQLLTIYRQARMTVVFVTHNIAEAISLATRIIVLGQGGQIIEDLQVTGDYPRSRTGPEFNALYNRLGMALGARQNE
jgi:NitT/TauT family transport system ATP-binding protein